MNSTYSDNDNDSVTSSSNQQDTKEAHEALHNAIGNMCNPNSNNPLSISLTATSQSKPVISKKGMEALTQLTFEYSQMLSRDLVAFSKHANRKTITLDDVKLCLRRNDNLLKQLNTHLQNQEEERMMEIRMGEGMQFMDQITNRNGNHGNEINGVAKHASDVDSSDDDDEIEFAVRKSSESDTLFDMNVQVDSSSSSDSSDEEDALTKRSEQIKSSRLKMSCKNDSDSDDDEFMKQLEKSKKGHDSVMKAKSNSMNAIELDSD